VNEIQQERDIFGDPAFLINRSFPEEQGILSLGYDGIIVPMEGVEDEELRELLEEFSIKVVRILKLGRVSGIIKTEDDAIALLRSEMSDPALQDLLGSIRFGEFGRTPVLNTAKFITTLRSIAAVSQAA